MRLPFVLFLFAGLADAQLRITTTSVPAATQYQSYIALLSAAGGTPPYTWSVVTSTNTSLPEGMSLDPTTGIVSAAQVYGQGGYSVVIRVTDSASPSYASATANLNFGVHSDASYGGCQMFPPDSIYNQRADQLPVDTDASHQIPSAYLNSPIHPDFGVGFYPVPGGIPFLRVRANQPPANLNSAYGGQIEGPGTYLWPIPPWPNVPFEGTAYGFDGEDHHILILQSSTNDINGPQTGGCILYEAYNSIYVPNMYDAGSNTWYVSGSVHYDLSGNQIAASSESLDNGANDSAGIPIVPLLMRYNEVPLGVRHPLRIAFNPPTNWFAWPATGCCTGSGPPQGLLYRLKANVNWQASCPVASYPQAATVLQALQQYGAYMSDHGGNGYVGGVPDDRWSDGDLACIKHFHASDLEVVDNSPLEVSAISGQTRPYVVPAVLPAGSVGASYSATFSSVGGNSAAIQWSVSSGSLPPGLVLDSSTGTISGMISSPAGSPFSFSITARDSNSGFSSDPQPFTIGLGPGSGVQLAVVKTHTGVFKKGLAGAFYTVTVSNSGTAPSSGTVTVTESVPTGMTLASMSGAGWNCPGGNTCSRVDPLGPNSNYPAITVTVNLSRTIDSQVTNEVSVAGGGSATANAQDITSIFPLDAQTIAFGPMTSQHLGTASFPVSATASSGLAVSFVSMTANVCTVSGATVTLVSAGTCTIEAAQPGAASWDAATPVDQSFTVTQADQGQVTTIGDCDVDHDGAVTVADIQLVINEVLRLRLPVDDLNRDGIVNLLDVLVVTNASTGLGCSVP